jgi:adenylate cyclase
MKRAHGLFIFGIGLAVGVVSIFSLSLGLFRAQESGIEDRLFSQKKVDPAIVVVSIDNGSIQKIGQWPWPRAVYGQLFAVLNAARPVAVGLDVMLSEPSRVGVADDNALSLSLQSISYPIVMPREENPPLAPLSLFTSAPKVSTGHVQFVTDPDGVVRTTYLVDSFAARVATIATGEKYSFASTTSRIVFAGGANAFPIIPFSSVLDGSRTSELAGKIVLIGATAADLHDDAIVPTSNGAPIPGVVIQANVVNMLTQNYRLDEPSFAVSSLLLLLAALLPAILFYLFPRSLVAVGLSVTGGIIFTIVALVLFDQGVVLDLIHIHLAWITSAVLLFLYRYFVTEKERREMRHAFGKYVSKDILEEILKDPKKVKLGGDEKDATVFFSDVRGFTTLSEKLTPAELVAFLNRYLSSMTDIALENRGVVDKYIGDAIMAFWGAPISEPDHARLAMRASLLMIDALVDFNAKNKAAGDLEIDIGIGLNSGPVIAGNMGSELRFDYTVMGDTVNLASRLEGQTKTYGVHIIASETSVAKISPDVAKQDNLLFRELDKIKVKGKTQPVTIFEVVERSKMATTSVVLRSFNTARDAYYAGKFAEAKTQFETILKDLPGDGPSKLLLERSAYFIEHPPENWVGVYEFKTK